MNKKLRFLLFSLFAVFMSSASFAGDKFTYNLGAKPGTSTPAGFFSYDTSGKWNFNTKFTGGEYDGITFSQGLKMEGSTKILFTSTATSTVIIVQSTYYANTIKFDGAELAIADAEAGTGCRIYTINDVAAGAHNITRGSGESGLFYVSVEYTGATLEVLETPTIDFDSATGEVTIEGDANATSIVYTTDGTDPSATNGDVYEAPFTVEDGTTVKAIALGDNETYANSEIATVKVSLDITSVAAPTFNVAYGTVAIACETADVTIEYSTDGENFSEYTKPITLFEDGTVYARASRDGLVSEVSSVEVTAVPMGDATNTIVMHFNAFDVQTVNGLSTLVGKDETEGYSISLNNDQKSWSSANSINGYTSIKVSNGAQNTLYLPNGVSATRITFYSYVNSAPGRDSGWKEVGDIDTQYKDVLMGAWQDAANPDVRTYPLTGEETEINFTNTGEQLCFYIVLDVVENKAALKAAYEPAVINMLSDEEFVAPTLTITNEDGDAVEGLEITFASSNEEVATVDADGNIEIVGVGEATITAKTTATDEYKSATATLKITVTPADQVLKVTENNTEAVLTQDEVNTHGYLTATDNWQTGEDKEYGKEKEYVGLFFNMSRPNRTLTITEKGAIAFEILVQNSTARRTYTYKVNDASETTITHNGGGVESSGIIECTSDQITITLAGTDASVYPVAVKFYTELPVSVTISDAKAATLYYSDKALIVPSGVKAYTIGRIDSKNVVKKGTEYASGETIPAGEAVVLEGTPDVYSFVIDNESTAVPSDGNLLKGTDEAAETTGGDKYYKLTVKDDVVGFYYGAEDGAAFTNGAHKAYLAVTGQTAAKFYLFNGEATGINTIAKVAEDGVVYNLQGVRVDTQNMTKGIYVVNGKKVVIK